MAPRPLAQGAPSEPGFLPLPVAADRLADYRMEANRRWRPALLGAHITRRMGESQEFREHTFYQLGDDVRHVDWRASARMRGRLGLAGSQNWLIRRFSAEEHYSFIFSVDNRDTMHYPVLPAQRRGAPAANFGKLQVARWIATALSWLALDAGDRVLLHPLFGRAGSSIRLRGEPPIAEVERRLDEFTREPATLETPNLADLDDSLPPAAVWVIITDMYFQPEAGQQLAARLRSAVSGRRWLILVNLDARPFERQLLATGPRRIGGPTRDEKRVYLTNTIVEETWQRIDEHTGRFLTAAGGGIEQSDWTWPTAERGRLEDLAPGAFFTQAFFRDEKLRQLWERDPWS